MSHLSIKNFFQYLGVFFFFLNWRISIRCIFFVAVSICTGPRLMERHPVKPWTPPPQKSTSCRLPGLRLPLGWDTAPAETQPSTTTSVWYLQWGRHALMKRRSLNLRGTTQQNAGGPAGVTAQPCRLEPVPETLICINPSQHSKSHNTQVLKTR